MAMMLATSLLPKPMALHIRVWVGIPAYSRVSFVLQKSTHWHNEVRTGMVSLLSTPTRPMLSGDMCLTAQNGPYKTVLFSDSIAYFNGESPGTCLEVQFALQPEIWLFEVDGVLMTPRVK